MTLISVISSNVELIEFSYTGTRSISFIIMLSSSYTGTRSISFIIMLSSGIKVSGSIVQTDNTDTQTDTQEYCIGAMMIATILYIIEV